MSEDVLCVFCKHFYFDMGCPGYSEATPGYGATISCNKNYWEMDNYGSLEEYREHIIAAKKCKDYEQVAGD